MAATYFQPWDWVICAGMNEDDAKGMLTQTDRVLNQLALWSVIAAIAGVAICVLGVSLFSRKMTASLAETVRVLRAVAGGDYRPRLNSLAG